MNRYIYMFHMPCFFFISGLLFNDKYLKSLKIEIYKRIKGYYWPFVKWSLIFLLFHNLFTYLHIYDDSYSLRDFAFKTIRIFTMTGSEQLLGGYWFLISLFWAATISLLFFPLLSRKKALTKISILGGVILTLLLAVAESRLTIKIPGQFHEQTLLALTFYMTGYLMKKIGLLHTKNLYVSLSLLMVRP